MKYISFVLVVLAIVAACTIVPRLLKGRRGAWLKRYGDIRGYQFQPHLPPALVEHCYKILGPRSGVKELRNVLSISNSGSIMYICDRHTADLEEMETVSVLKTNTNVTASLQVKMRAPAVFGLVTKLQTRVLTGLVECELDSGGMFTERFIVYSDDKSAAKVLLSENLKRELLQFHERFGSLTPTVFGLHGNYIALCTKRITGEAEMDMFIQHSKAIARIVTNECVQRA